jgi:hypothetical protein
MQRVRVERLRGGEGESRRPAIDRLEEDALAGINAVPQLHQSRHVPLRLLVKYVSVRFVEPWPAHYSTTSDAWVRSDTLCGHDTPR